MTTTDQSATPFPAKTDSAGVTPILEAVGLCIRFGPVIANDHVNLALRPGEVHNHPARRAQRQHLFR